MKFEKTTVRVLAVVAIALLILASGLALSAGGVVRISAGPAQPANSVLVVDDSTNGNPKAQSSPLITTVRAEELTKWQALTCSLKPSCDTLVLADPLDSGTPATQMDDSIDTASAAADALLGDKAVYPGAPGTGMTVRNIGGPSAGLTLSLHFVNLRSSGDLFARHMVAASGTVTANGAVGAVGGVSQKAEGARAAGADVLFVPEDERDQVKTAGKRLTVVGVSSVSEAVDWLCAHDATSTAC